jgi:hypothetical protein
MCLTRMGSESAAERRQSYQRKHAVSESSAILGSESSRKSYFVVSNKMNMQTSATRILSAALSSLVLCSVCLSVSAQQTNPNRLPPCPRPDYSKNTDWERFAKWTNCWGRYKIELLTENKGDVLEGEWRNGTLHVQGTYTYANGDKYVGEFKDGKYHGQGTEIHANGSKYVGEYKDDKRHGHGTYTHANGNRYVGEFKDGNLHGQGTYTYANGDKYVGEFKGGKMQGQGTYTHANGNKNVGEFNDDKLHGQGIGTMVDGRRFEGIWENNNFIREAKVNLPGQNVKSTRTTQDSNTSDTSANSFGVEGAKVKCQELGFKTGTERYGKGVLDLSR